MSRGEQDAGLSGLLFGARWQTGAWRAVAIFVLAYILPAALMAPASRTAAFLKLLATVLSFVFTAGAVYKLLQSRSNEDWSAEEDEIADVSPPLAARTEARPDAVADESGVVATGAALPPAEAPDIASLGQVALERLCMALYQFNGLNSRMIVAGAAGEYRIRLVPRNTDKAIAILQCRAGSEEQGVVAYAALLRIMEEEGLEKAFFVAPAGFAPDVSAEARARHVTLVDRKLLLAMIDRLPESAKATVFSAAA